MEKTRRTATQDKKSGLLDRKRSGWRRGVFLEIRLAAESQVTRVHAEGPEGWSFLQAVNSWLNRRC